MTPALAAAMAGFRPGKYNHYKGGQYVALCLARDHETREVLVVYVSLSTGAVCARPLATPGKDSWTDHVQWTGRVPGDGDMGPRFVRILDAEQPE